jgi:acetyl esterase/lipase
MKKINSLALIALGLCIGFSTNAQTRYLNDTFTEVSVTENVQYGANVGIITQSAAMENLYMDVYQPAGDTVTNRPVVIMLHTGSFLPAIVNGQPTGDKSDNAIVEMCERFAKKGFVAIALNYRLGWNPISPSEDVRRSTLIQAAYRGLQDVKTAVRFLRKSALEEGNPYGVGDKIAVGGYGTGGYLSLSLATLNDYESELLLPKFIDTSEETIATFGQAMPYIIPSIMGNFEATDYGVLPMDLDGDGIPETDVPMCVPNHVGYNSEVDMVFNAGGALPDISWLEAGEVPIASMHNIADPDAPYAEGDVIVPTTGEFVIVAHGSQLVQETADSLGNNAVFEGLSTTITDATYNNGVGADNAAVAGHDDLAGLFGIITSEPSGEPTLCGYQTVQGAPWDWWDNDTYGAMADAYQGVTPGTMGCLALLGNPDMSEDKGLAFTDMMSEFFMPRVFVALNADDAIETEILGTNDIEQFDLSIFPNPAKNEMRISTNIEMNSYDLYDLTGKLIFTRSNIKSNTTSIKRNGLNSGLYLTRITDVNGNSVIRKIIFE